MQCLDKMKTRNSTEDKSIILNFFQELCSLGSQALEAKSLSMKTAVKELIELLLPPEAQLTRAALSDPLQNKNGIFQ